MTIQTARAQGRNSPCSCGSGKKFKQCCGAAGRAAISTDTLDHVLRNCTVLLQSGDPRAALTNLRGLQTQHPKHPLVAYLTGYASLESGLPDEAVAHIGASLALGLSDAAAYFHLGRAYVAKGEYQAAAAAFDQAIVLRPEFDEARLFLANSQVELGLYSDAAKAYRAILAQTPESAELLYNLAHAGFQSGEVSAAEAAAMLRRAIARNPANGNIHAALSLILETDNQLDEAEASARRAFALAPNAPTCATALAKVLTRRGRHEDALEVIAGTGSGGSLIERMGLCAARGQALEKLARHGEAIAEYRNAKRLQSTVTRDRFDPGGLASELQRQREFFITSRLERLSTHAASCTPTPVFIVGFYRCGSTLLEQMLGMHPDVLTYGEQKTLGDIEAAFGEGYPECLNDGSAAMRAERLASASQAYFKKLPLSADASHPKFVVDKELMNVLRLPLIRLLFPTARVIHVLRHPLDSAISALSQVFLGSAPWAASLADTARFYAMAWEHVQATRRLPGLNYLSVRYEELVGAPEPTLQRVAEFIGAKWDPAMLKFHESARKVRTASYAQVTRPLYHESVERFRPFLPYIEPEVLTVMEPVVLGMGYRL